MVRLVGRVRLINFLNIMQVKKIMGKKLDKKKRPRQLKGIVVSDKMDKTIVVLVSRIKAHPKYKKRYNVSLKVKAHDLENKAKIGNTVLIEQCRPISSGKHYRFVKLLLH